jgi:hypothetical protein
MNKAHGSPYDRGGADRYYGRPHNPHRIDYIGGRGYTVKTEDLSPQEISEYNVGWNMEQGRKNYGDGSFAPEQHNV